MRKDKHGMTTDQQLTWIGYRLERQRQDGSEQIGCHGKWDVKDVEDAMIMHMLDDKHLYRRGLNAPLYLQEGRACVSQLALIIGYGTKDNQMPAEIFMDYWNEFIEVDGHELNTRIYQAIKDDLLH